MNDIVLPELRRVGKVVVTAGFISAAVVMLLLVFNASLLRELVQQVKGIRHDARTHKQINQPPASTGGGQR